MVTAFIQSMLLVLFSFCLFYFLTSLGLGFDYSNKKSIILIIFSFLIGGILVVLSIFSNYSIIQYINSIIYSIFPNQPIQQTNSTIYSIGIALIFFSSFLLIFLLIEEVVFEFVIDKIRDRFQIKESRESRECNQMSMNYCVNWRRRSATLVVFLLPVLAQVRPFFGFWGYQSISTSQRTAISISILASMYIMFGFMQSMSKMLLLNYLNQPSCMIEYADKQYIFIKNIFIKWGWLIILGLIGAILLGGLSFEFVIISVTTFLLFSPIWINISALLNTYRPEEFDIKKFRENFLWQIFKLFGTGVASLYILKMLNMPVLNSWAIATGIMSVVSSRIIDKRFVAVNYNFFRDFSNRLKENPGYVDTQRLPHDKRIRAEARQFERYGWWYASILFMDTVLNWFLGGSFRKLIPQVTYEKASAVASVYFLLSVVFTKISFTKFIKAFWKLMHESSLIGFYKKTQGLYWKNMLVVLEGEFVSGIITCTVWWRFINIGHETTIANALIPFVLKLIAYTGLNLGLYNQAILVSGLNLGLYKDLVSDRNIENITNSVKWSTITGAVLGLALCFMGWGSNTPVLGLLIASWLHFGITLRIIYSELSIYR